MKLEFVGLDVEILTVTVQLDIFSVDILPSLEAEYYRIMWNN